MTRSGIKRGLAISAVSALSVVGLPAAAHASTTGITVSAANPSVTAFQYDNVSISATTDAGALATVPVTLALTVPAGGAAPTSFSVKDLTAGSSATVTPGAPTSNADGSKTYSGSYTATLTKNAASLSVAADAAGSLAITAADPNGVKGAATVTVTNWKDADTAGASAVSKLTASTNSISDFDTDWSTGAAPDNVNGLVVTPTNAAGLPVGDVALDYSILGSAGVVDSGETTAVAPGFDNAPFGQAIDLSAITAAGTYSVKVFADLNNDDAWQVGEPVANATVTLADNTFNNADTKNVSAANSQAKATVTGANTAGADPIVKSGTTSVVLNLQTLNTAATPAAVGGVPLGVDVTIDGVAQKRQNVTTGADGKVSVTIAVPADKAKDGIEVDYAAYVSRSTQVGAGDAVVADGYFLFADAAPTVKLASGSGTAVQAVPGSSISIPVVESDQWGNPLNHALRFEVDGTPVSLVSVSNGAATISYPDSTPASALGSTDTVDVFDGVTGASLTSFTVTFVESTAVAGFAVNVDPSDSAPLNVAGATQPVAAGTALTYKAIVTNAQGLPVLNAPVSFSVDNGFVSTDGLAKTSTSKMVTAYTGTGGIATVYVGSTAAKTQTVSAVAGGKSVTFKPVSYAAGSAYAVSAAPIAPITVGGSAKVVATVVDAFGNPISGFDLGFVQSGAGALAGGASSALGVTASDGTASVTLDGLDKVGSGTVTIDKSGTTSVFAGADVAGATQTRYSKAITVDYKVVAAPADNGGGTTPPPPAKPAVKSAKGHSQGKKDVLVVRVANANGKKVVVRVHGKKVGTAVVKNGKAVVRVKDKNGKKATKYTVVVAGVKKALKLK